MCEISRGLNDLFGMPQPLSGPALAAKQMGNYAGRLIAAGVAGQSLPPFVIGIREVSRRSVRLATVVELNHI
jgi:hypothetical protein